MNRCSESKLQNRSQSKKLKLSFIHFSFSFVHLENIATLTYSVKTSESIEAIGSQSEIRADELFYDFDFFLSHNEWK